MNVGVQISAWDFFFILLGIYLEVKLLTHMVIIFLIFWGTIILFSIVVTPFYISTGIVWEVFSGSPHPHQQFILLFCLDLAILMVIKWYLIVILWFSYYISLISVAVEHLFMWLLAICKYSLEKYLLVFCLIFNPIVVCSSLYILDINSLSDIWFEDNFSYSVDCLFTLLIVSFDG